ncbi:MAG: tetratricopeptide repeat protein [Proteobacteria bacterium]|nr:tetratricopeptide repeat protein [Pseudomonadota bacterium]
MAQNAEDITTNTIAELYIKQGYFDKALDIYKTILEIDPTNEGASTKLKEIEAMMAEAAGEDSKPSDVSGDTSSGPIAVEAQIARLESWLAAIQEMRGVN